MRVLVYPEKKWEEFGAERWVCEWTELKASAQSKDSDDIDHDLDVETFCTAHTTKAAALKKAKQMSERAFYGSCVYQQRVDWFVEEDHVAEWRAVGEPEYL